jgi:DNA-binding MarR family transcriptional regulator
MAVNRNSRTRRRGGNPAAAGAPPRMNRRLVKRMRMPEGGDALPYPRRLLAYPSALMFLLMREAFRLGQKRSLEATTPVEQMRFPHFAILASLDEFGPTSQKEISDRLRFDPSDLVGFVDWLEKAGLVERRRDERDRRRYALELTAAGRRSLDARAQSAERLNAELFGSLTRDQRRELHDLLLRAVASRSPGAASAHPA